MTINDSNWQFLHAATGLSLPFNDMYFRYLRDLGYTGTLQQMIAASGLGLNPSGLKNPIHSSSNLHDPEWAPIAVRTLAPVFASDYTASEEWPNVDTFVASTVRRMRSDSNVLVINDFAINTPRQDSRGRYLEAWAIDRLITAGDNPVTGLATSGNAVITAMAGNPQGSHNSARIATGVTTSINALGQSSAFAATIGDPLVCSFMFQWGTSGRLRIRLTSGAGTSTASLIKGGSFAYPDSTNGLIAAEIVDLGNDIFLCIARVTAASTQAAFRWMIGPNLATAGVDIIVHEVNPSKTRHPVEIITAVAATGGDFQTRDITGVDLHSFAGRFILYGWAAGITEAVIWQADDGSNNNRTVLYVNTTTLALKAKFIIGGVTIADLSLGTVVVGAPFTAQLDWRASLWRAQMYGGSLQSNTSVGVMPALTIARFGKSFSSNQSAIRIVNAFGFSRMVSDNQIAGVLAAATAPFDPLDVVTQARLDTPQTINEQSYIKDAFPGLWTIQKSVNTPSRLRFETRLNYRDDYDQQNDRDYIRSELHSVPNSPVGEIWFSFKVTPVSIAGALPIFEDDGVTRRAYTQANICQLKSLPDPTGLPMFAININSDGFRVIIGGGDSIVGADGNDRSDYYYQNIIPTVGVTETWLVQIKPGIPNVGYVRLWNNQRKILDVNNIYIGYPETTDMFSKSGLYCNKNVGGMIVDIDSFKIGSDLSYLIPR